ncbi:MAG: sodium:calcium antiporter [Thermodesulfobacteriota bacterium]
MTKLLPLYLAVLACLPGLGLNLAGIHLSPPATAAIAGVAILGASFLLLWACDVAQSDIPQALALAVVAFIAVLPEYAVDMYFTWMAGKHPESDYASYAIANMTGANRLIIGVAWSAVVFLAWWRTRRAIVLDQDRRTDVLFLGLATLYSLVIPLKGSLAWYDGLVLVALYAWYIRIAAKRPCVENELEGPAAVLGRLPQGQRRLATLLLFLFSAGVILANAEAFSEGLVATGRQFGINEFLLVQWLAPLASESPEFIVAIMFTLRGHASVALASLLSSKLNQWTLLVGMIPAVYGVSAGSFAQPFPMGEFQMKELLLTSAQSLLAVGLLADLRLSVREASVLLALFSVQFIAPAIPGNWLEILRVPATGQEIHFMTSAAYFLAFFLLVPRRGRDMLWLRRGLRP